MSKYAATTNHKFLQLPNETLGRYNLWDSYNTARDAILLDRTLKKQNQHEFYHQHVVPLQTAVVNMQSRGMVLDTEALRSYKSEVLRELRDTDRGILQHDTAGTVSTPTPSYPNGLNAPQRVAKFLFEDLGLKSTKKTATGLMSSDQEALYSVLNGFRKKDEHLRPVVEALFHRTRLATIRKRYVNFTADADGRVRARVKLTGTKTWRFAYAEPALQQFPPEARRVFVAAPGKVLVSVDYSQLEARLLAYLSGDAPSIAVFDSGEDIHASNARDLFNLTPAAWAELPDKQRGLMRNFAKTFLYGISYGGQAETMKLKLFCPCALCAAKVPQTLNIKRTAIRQAELRWFRIHQAVPAYQRELADFVRKHHYYEHPLGYRRYIGTPWGSELDRELKNIPMQLGGALLMNDSQVELDRMGMPIVLQHHDSFVFEVEKERVDEVVKVARDVMERPIPQFGGARIPVDVEVGHNWGKYDEDNPEVNPEGLRKAS